MWVSSVLPLVSSDFFPPLGSRDEGEFCSVKGVGRRAWGEVLEAWARAGRGGASGMGGRHGHSSWEAAVCAGEA